MLRVYNEERRARDIFTGGLNVADYTEKSWSAYEAARRGSQGWGFLRMLEDGAANEIGKEIVARRKRDALLEGEQDLQAAEFLSVRNRGAALEVKDSLAAMILADPERFDVDTARLGFSGAIAEEHFLDLREAFREIGEEFGGDFALVAARAQDVRERHPTLRFRVQW
jgi:hypothetical protein